MGVNGTPGGSVPLLSPIQNTFGTGNNDGYVSVINASGTALVFSSYLGGDDDFLSGFGVDGARNLYLSGLAMDGFPITNASDGVYVPIFADTHNLCGVCPGSPDGSSPDHGSAGNSAPIPLRK